MSNNSLVISSLTPQISQPPSLNLMDCAHLGAYAFYGHHEALNEVFQKNSCMQTLDKPLSKYKLTPLQLAVIKKDLQATQSLCEQGANPNKKAYKGYTALHLAALNNDQAMADFLIKHCKAAQQVKDENSGTYQKLFDFQRLGTEVSLSLDGSSSLNTLFPIDEMPSHINFSLKCAPKGWTYVGEMVVDQNKLMKDWLEMREENLDITSPEVLLKLKERLKAFREKPKSLKLLQTENVGCGVFANEAFQKYDIIGEYLGKIENPESIQDATYVLENVDASQYRNEIGIANDGFPNARVIPLPKFEGLERRIFLVALRKIDKGEQILWDYGSDYFLKVGKRTELNEQKMLQFFKESRFTKTLSKLEDKAMFFELSSYCHYILHTPSAFFNLIKNELITLKELPTIANRVWEFLTTDENRALLNTPLAFAPLLKSLETLKSLDNEIYKKVIVIYENALQEFEASETAALALPVTNPLHIRTANAFDKFNQGLKGELKKSSRFRVRVLNRLLNKLKNDLKVGAEEDYSDERLKTVLDRLWTS